MLISLLSHKEQKVSSKLARLHKEIQLNIEIARYLFFWCFVFVLFQVVVREVTVLTVLSVLSVVLNVLMVLTVGLAREGIYIDNI